MVSRFHQLIQVPVHVFHGNVKLLRCWIKENVESRNKVRVDRELFEEDDFPQLKAWLERFERLFHRFDRNLSRFLSRLENSFLTKIKGRLETKVGLGAPYQSPSPSDATACASGLSQHNAAETTISDFLDDFEPVRERHGAR
jgi:hypothetical protein